MRDRFLPEDTQDSVTPAPRDPPAHRFYNCAICGQRVDRAKLAQAFHHDDQPHEPMAETE
jgi:hypothetical protein